MEGGTQVEHVPVSIPTPKETSLASSHNICSSDANLLLAVKHSQATVNHRSELNASLPGRITILPTTHSSEGVNIAGNQKPPAAPSHHQSISPQIISARSILIHSVPGKGQVNIQNGSNMIIPNEHGSPVNRHIIIMQPQLPENLPPPHDATSGQSISVVAPNDNSHQDARRMYPVQYMADSQPSNGEVLYSATSQRSPAQQDLQSANSYNLFANEEDYENQLGGYFPQQPRSYQSEVDSTSSTYLIKTENVRSHQGQEALEEEAAAQQLSHTTRASPATIHWLLQNYETAEGVSLPRCTLYNHYLKHCTEHKLDPVNAASFGKLIRSVFLGLRTRRLGTRGNSKYHYYGIRMKPDSPLSRFNEENIMAIRQKPAAMSKRMTRAASSAAPCDNEVNVVGTDSTSLPVSQSAGSAPAPATPVTDNPDQMTKVEIQQSYLGQGTVPNLLPPMLQSSELEQIDLNVEQVETFFTRYRMHCQNILNLVRTMNFCDIDLFWRYFWQPTELTGSLDEENADSLSAGPSSGLTRQQLHDLCTLKPIQKYIHVMDCQFYQVIVNILLVNVLRPMPSLLTQSIRNFAKQLETSLSESLVGLPEAVQCIKLDAARSFAQILRRYTSLNHLAQAARAVLQNSAQMNQMLADLNRVDFRNVQEQAGWVCGCDFSMVQQIEQDFKETLEKPKSLEQLAGWLDLIVGRALPPCSSGEIFRLHREARKFLLHWSFYSAPSFGSFHLIRLLFDEYMFFLVEQRIASAADLPAVAIMSQSYRKKLSSDYFTNNLSTADKTHDFHTQGGSMPVCAGYQSNSGVERINGNGVHSLDPCGITLGTMRVPQAEGPYVSNSNQEDPVSYFIPGMSIQRQQHILELRGKERNLSLPGKAKIVVNGHLSSVLTNDSLLPGSRDPNALIYYCTERESPSGDAGPLMKKTKSELPM